MKKSKILGVIGAIATLLALISASTACTWALHQPRMPKCLNK
ncbi:MAG TPA: cyclic lactone autoinducer peptide [Clostridiaceae bacterium]|nr:cyclic lactone autoinducer peptide [Clostridiaceae bacterium]